MLIQHFESGSLVLTILPAAEFGVKKSGHEGQFGRDKQEKATDALRTGYEKMTG